MISSRKEYFGQALTGSRMLGEVADTDHFPVFVPVGHITDLIDSLRPGETPGTTLESA